MIIMIVIFFIVSIVLSMVGFGGGVLYVPILLAFGYGFQESSTISLFLITITGLSAFSRFKRAKLVDLKLAVILELFTAVGAFVGGFTSVHFHEEYLKILFGILLIMATIFLLNMQNGKTNKKSLKTGFGYWQRKFNGSNYSISIPLIIPVMFTIGYLAGLLGVAGGFMKIPVMILWFGVPAKIAIATSSLMVGLTGVFGLGGHLFSVSINWRLAVELGIVVFTGGQIGSKISIGLPEKKITIVLAYILLIIGVYMIFRSAFL